MQLTFELIFDMFGIETCQLLILDFSRSRILLKTVLFVGELLLLHLVSCLHTS